MTYISYDPSEFYNILAQKGLTDDMYDALNKGDTGHMIIAALEILRKTNKFPQNDRIPKNEESVSLCNVGDRATQSKHYNIALIAYNRAILQAPKDSQSMVNAYLGRCRLLFKMHAFTDCSIEIEKCLSTCKSTKIKTELNNMKASCLSLKWIDVPITNPFIDNFFKLNDDKHPLVTCASASIDIIKENGVAKVIAAKNIPVGKLVALEKAYVGHVNKTNRYLACHYCHKFSLNLIPCDSCCECLFCNNDCKQLCWAEYHKVECQIIHIIDETCPDDRYLLSTRTALKLKMSCSWGEFISISSNMGLNKKNNSSVNEIYDVNNKTSILNYNDETYFPLGSTFNSSFIIAVIINYLQELPDFFPVKKNEKEEAMRAFGKVILHLYVTFPVQLEYANAARNLSHMIFTSEADENSAFYCFTSKLRHSCDANLLLLGLNSTAALLAIKPIKPGEELRISHLGHWYETVYERRTNKVFQVSETICQCKVCEGQWDPRRNLTAAIMTKQQLKPFRTCNAVSVNMLNPGDIEKKFKELCRCLGALSDLPHTKEHYKIFREFRDLITFFQCHSTGNVTVL